MYYLYIPVLHAVLTPQGGTEVLALTTKSLGAILSANPEGVSLMDEANKKLLFLKVILLLGKTKKQAFIRFK